MQLTMKQLRCLAAVAIACISFSLQARIQYVTVESEGIGASMQAAINAALVNAVSEVNGTEIASKTHLQTSEISNNDVVESAETFQQSINKKTNGLIKEYVVLNKQQSEFSNGSWSAMVRVTIAKYDVSKQAKRIRVVVLPFAISENIPGWKKPEEFHNNIVNSLISYLTHTRKFAMLDRENMKDQDNELSIIHKGNVSAEELVKLGQRLATDYIIVGDIDEIHYHKNNQQLKMSGKTITSIKQGARVLYRVIDVATGQIKYSDSFDKILFSSNSRVSSAMVAEKTAHEIGSVITNAIYPIRVESIRNKDVFVGQGGKTLRKGEEYSLVMLGNALKDSYTGESLGREERVIGTVKITQVQAKQSQGIIMKSKVNVAKLFRPGDFIIRPKNKSAPKKESFDKQEKAAKKSVDAFENSLSSDW